MASLSDVADICTILSLPFAVVAYLVTKNRFSSWWKQWNKYIIIVVYILTLVGIYRLGWLTWIYISIEIPVWLIILIVLIGLFIIVFFPYFIEEEEACPEYLKYKNDVIQSILCQWKYNDDGTINNASLAYFCANKNCSSRLEAGVTPMFDDYIEISCPHCGFSKKFDLSVSDFNRRIIMEIERRLRTSEYKKRLKELEAQ